MNVRPTLALVLLAAPLGADDKKPDPKAAAALVGKWQAVSGSFSGEELPAATVKKRVLVFTETEFTAYEGDKKGRTLTFTLDPSADPKRIDLAPAGRGQKAAGIYAVDGDELRLCYAEPGADRPAKFESKPGSRVFLLVLKRVQE